MSQLDQIEREITQLFARKQKLDGEAACLKRTADNLSAAGARVFRRIAEINRRLDGLRVTWEQNERNRRENTRIQRHNEMLELATRHLELDGNSQEAANRRIHAQITALNTPGYLRSICDFETLNRQIQRLLLEQQERLVGSTEIIQKSSVVNSLRAKVEKKRASVDKKLSVLTAKRNQIMLEAGSLRHQLEIQLGKLEHLERYQSYEKLQEQIVLQVGVLSGQLEVLNGELYM